MPTITCNISDLNMLLGKNLTYKEWDKFSYLYKGELKEYNEKTKEIKIELQDTNRPDLWCAEGIARQVSFKIRNNGNQKYKNILSSASNISDKLFIIDQEMLNIRPYAAGIAIKNVEITEDVLISFIQTQEKLAENLGRHRETLSIGIYDLDAIKFPVKYTAVERSDIKFVPLGYDRKMTPEEILEVHPKGIKYKHLLNGYSKVPILLDSENNVLSFPPIINSRASGEVKTGRRNLFIEATGTNLLQLVLALNIFTFNLKDRNAEIESVQIQFPYETPLGKQFYLPYNFNLKTKISTKDVFNLLGYKLDLVEIANSLKEYGYLIQKEKDEIVVFMPPWRYDLIHKVDVIEDIAISIGYDFFKPVMPQHYTIGKLSRRTILSDRVRDIVLSFGFEEIVSNVLCNKEEFTTAMRESERPIIELANPMTEKFNALRDRIIPSLLRVERDSSQAMYPHKIFEVGEISTFESGTATGCTTENHLGLMIADKDAELSNVHSFLEHLFFELNLDFYLEAFDIPIFLPGRSGKIYAKGKEVGWIGEIHPEILENFDITMPCAVFEINLKKIDELTRR